MTEINTLYGEGVSPAESKFLEAMKFTHLKTNRVIDTVLQDADKSRFSVGDFGSGPYPLYTRTCAYLGAETYFAYDKSVNQDGVSTVEQFRDSYTNWPNTGSDWGSMEVVAIKTDVAKVQSITRTHDVVLMNHLLQHLPEKEATKLVYDAKRPGNILIISSYDWRPTLAAVDYYELPVQEFVQCALDLFSHVGSNPFFGSRENLLTFYNKSTLEASAGLDIDTYFFDRQLGDYKSEVVELASSLLAFAQRIGQTSIIEKLVPAMEAMRQMKRVSLVPATLSFLIIK